MESHGKQKGEFAAVEKWDKLYLYCGIMTRVVLVLQFSTNFPAE
jgi:hypothetical protein